MRHSGAELVLMQASDAIDLGGQELERRVGKAESVAEAAETVYEAVVLRVIFAGLILVAVSGVALILAPFGRARAFAAAAGAAGVAHFGLGTGLSGEVGIVAAWLVVVLGVVLAWRVVRGGGRVLARVIALGAVAVVLVPDEDVLWGARATALALALAVWLESGELTSPGVARVPRRARLETRPRAVIAG